MTDKWNVRWEISVGDVVGLISAIAAVLLAYGKLDTRLSLAEQSIASQTLEQKEAVRRVEQSIAEMNHKLDRLIERR